MQETRLAAIMFTDIAGYSRLMEDDEVRTIELLHEHNEIVFPLIEQASGTIVDAIGDGLLVTFPSVLNAVRCAVDIQTAIDEHNGSAPSDRQFYLRIGIHLGEIWEEGDRVYGNGVNVAARVQPFAVPGGVCITEDVHRQVANKLTVPTVSIGTRELKNIARRMEIFRVVTGHEATDSERRAVGVPADDDGSLDAIKERLLQERERIASKRGRGESDKPSLGRAIEDRVFNIVERAMDAAIDKWEKLPEDKRREALEHGNWHTETGKVGLPRVSVSTDGAGQSGGRLSHGPHHRGDGGRAGDAVAEKHGGGKHGGEKPGGDLSAGAVFGVGFGIGYFAFGIGWMIWPFLLLGVLPTLSGLRKIVRRILRDRERKRSRPLQIEKDILAAAKRLGGRVTVVQISAETDLSLDEAQEHLERMAAKGYVSQDISPNGVIEFEFPSLVSCESDS